MSPVISAKVTAAAAPTLVTAGASFTSVTVMTTVTTSLFSMSMSAMGVWGTPNGSVARTTTV